MTPRKILAALAALFRDGRDTVTPCLHSGGNCCTVSQSAPSAARNWSKGRPRPGNSRASWSPA